MATEAMEDLTVSVSHVHYKRLTFGAQGHRSNDNDQRAAALGSHHRFVKRPNWGALPPFSRWPNLMPVEVNFWAVADNGYEQTKRVSGRSAYDLYG